MKLAGERILIEECRRQSRRAQKQLVEDYYMKMLAVCMRYLRNEEDARDVLNGAFLQVLTNIGRFKEECSLEHWMRRIVTNAAIDFVRKNRSYRDNFVQTAEIGLYRLPMDEEQETGNFSAATDLPAQSLFEMITTLPPATRVVFNMYAIDGMGHREISRRLGIGEATSRWHLSNARSILKQRISDALNDMNRLTTHDKKGIKGY